MSEACERTLALDTRPDRHLSPAALPSDSIAGQISAELHSHVSRPLTIESIRQRGSAPSSVALDGLQMGVPGCKPR